jgi:hypothetical protein
MHKLHQKVELSRPSPRRASIETFERDLPQLLREHPGQWVAYHHDRPLGIFASKDEAVRTCLARRVPELEI